jgi:hypothetical protein
MLFALPLLPEKSGSLAALLFEKCRTRHSECTLFDFRISVPRPQLDAAVSDITIRRNDVDIPNAFIGKAEKPTPKEIATALGSTREIWEQLVNWLAQEHGVTVQEWKSISPKYGWSLRLRLKKRTVVHMSPCDGCFRVAFILGDRAVKAARESDLPKTVIKLIADAPRYAEGTGIRLLMRSEKDLVPARKLAVIKLAN